ncbi:hypothetical protein LENED_010325 [Lentinula edodes]|uniref:Uncharacterized protein n=1 Tax=Lentinula edodes TaxID=5353 RepID=A0A1Q3EM69_LENED|nr:hypothetical protein LENED_010325 [Lentinula edodes]
MYVHCASPELVPQRPPHSSPRNAVYIKHSKLFKPEKSGCIKNATYLFTSETSVEDTADFHLRDSVSESSSIALVCINAPTSIVEVVVFVEQSAEVFKASVIKQFDQELTYVFTR